MSLLREIKGLEAVTAWSPIASIKSVVAVATKDSLNFADQVIGSSSGASNEGNRGNVGAELILYDVNPAIFEEDDKFKSPQVFGKIKTKEKFSALAWGHRGPSDLGIVAGGMKSGGINVWDPKEIQRSHEVPLCQIMKHKSKVLCMDFSTLDKGQHLLASGGSESEVYVTDLKVPNKPTSFSPDGSRSTPGTTPNGSNSETLHVQGKVNKIGSSGTANAEIQCIAWNSQVVHVLASGSSNGVLNIWDLRQKSAWCVVRDAKGCGYTYCGWNPSQGLHLLTYSNDPMQPVQALKLYDLRRSTAHPITQYSIESMTKPIVSASWSVSDPMILGSCDEDGRVLIWDIYTGKVVQDWNDPTGDALGNLKRQKAQSISGGFSGLQSHHFGENDGHASALFGGPIGGDANDIFGTKGGDFSGTTYNPIRDGDATKFNLSFSPLLPGIALTCSYDKKVQIHSIHSYGSLNYQKKISNSVNIEGTLRVPKWQKRSIGCNFGFGNKFVKIIGKTVKVCFVQEDTKFVNDAVKLEQDLANVLQEMGTQQQENTEVSSLIKQYCESKGHVESDSFYREIWKFMPTVFSTINKTSLLPYLGFNEANIKREISSAVKNDSLENETGITHADEVAPNIEPKGLDMDAIGGLQNLSFAAHTNTDANAADFFGTGLADGNESPNFNHERGQSMQSQDFANVSENKGSELRIDDSSNKEDIKVNTKGKINAAANKVERIIKVREDPLTNTLVKKCLMLGDFKAGVKVLIENERFADALLLSTCGGEDLWNYCVGKYLKHTTEVAHSRSTGNKDEYVSLMAAVLQGDFSEFINNENVNLNSWKEILATVAQYAKPDELSEHCDELGNKLKENLDGHLTLKLTERQEYFKAAMICYLCALSISDFIELIKLYQDQSNAGSSATLNEREDALLNLHKLVEKLSFLRAGLSSQLDVFTFSEAVKAMFQYSTELALIGQLDYAASYLSLLVQPELDDQDDDYDMMNTLFLAVYALRDRIFGGHPNPAESLIHFIPEKWFPFEMTSLTTATVVDQKVVYMQAKQQKQQQQHQQALSQANQETTENHERTFASQMHAPQALQSTVSLNENNVGNFQQISTNGWGYNQPNLVQTQSFNNSVSPTKPRVAPAIPINDGFGTTVGNPAAAQKYGNFTTSNLNVNLSQNVTEVAPSINQNVASNVTSGQYQRSPQKLVSVQQQQQQQINPNTLNRKQSVASSISNFDHLGNPIPAPNLHSTHIFNPNIPQTIHEQAQAAPVASTSQSAPVQKPAAAKIMPEGMQFVMDALRQFVAALMASEVSAAESKLLEVGNKSLDILNEKMMSNGVNVDLQEELKLLAQHLNAYDFNSANQVKLSITRHHWTTQKDWLKGFSQIINLAHKKYPPQY